jgi:hypothetical protein
LFDTKLSLFFPNPKLKLLAAALSTGYQQIQSYLQAFLLLLIHTMPYEKKAVRIYGDGKHRGFKRERLLDSRDLFTCDIKVFQGSISFLHSFVSLVSSPTLHLSVQILLLNRCTKLNPRCNWWID